MGTTHRMGTVYKLNWMNPLVHIRTRGQDTHTLKVWAWVPSLIMSHLVSVSANIYTPHVRNVRKSTHQLSIAQLIAPELGWGASTRSCRIFRAAFRSSLSRAKRGTWPDHLGRGKLRHKQMQLTSGRAKLFLRRCNDLDQRWPCDQTCWDRRLETGGCFIRLRDWNLRPLSKFQPKWVYCGTAASKYRSNNHSELGLNGWTIWKRVK